jgi:phosphopantothenoylcysteine decarboxylase/phosphopantothenate--cysteine ligase
MPESHNQISLKGRKLLLGVSGGIAAYKTAELVRLFKKSGAEVQVLMTRNAARFITPLTLGTLSEREVLTEIFPENETGSWTKHVSLGLWGDVYVIAPATADTLAKLANGFCDSMLTAVALAARCPILVCPSMDVDMYRHPAVRKNLDRLREMGYEVMEAAYGPLASGLVGEGRMPEPSDIFARVEALLGGTTSSSPLSGKRVLVSAGPTRESIDPVRFLTNHSTGTMGFALAAAAQRRGAHVTLVSGPTDLDTPPGVTRTDVVTADEMYEAVLRHSDADVVIMAAAVADYAPADSSPSKIKKSETELVLRLRKTRDILAELGRRKRKGQTLVGFALETDDVLANAQKKLESKNLDWIVANNLREAGAGFGKETNRVTLIRRDGHREELPLDSKHAVAEAILDRITSGL